MASCPYRNRSPCQLKQCPTSQFFETGCDKSSKTKGKPFRLSIKIFYLFVIFSNFFILAYGTLPANQITKLQTIPLVPARFKRRFDPAYQKTEVCHDDDRFRQPLSSRHLRTKTVMMQNKERINMSLNGSRKRPRKNRAQELSTAMLRRPSVFREKSVSARLKSRKFLPKKPTNGSPTVLSSKK